MKKKKWARDGWMSALRDYSCRFWGKATPKGTRYFRVASERGPYNPFNPPPGAYCEEACVGQEHWKGV